MTEFKAPPPPPASFTDTPVPTQNPEPVVAPAEVPVHEAEVSAGVQSEKPAGGNEKVQALKALFESNKEEILKSASSKPVMIMVVLMFVVGLLFGALLFGGGDSQPAPVVQGLQGVVTNPDITQQLRRCGQVEASSACVLYVMNYATYDKLARDFFETAVAATGRSAMLIGVDNVRYAGLKIPPGYFAQIKIPAYK